MIQKTAFGAVLAMAQSGQDCAIATVIHTAGSSPRPVGAQLAIAQDGHFEGSVSGGCVEGAIVSEAMYCFDASSFVKSAPKIMDFCEKTDDPFSVGMACGGAIKVLLEPIGEDGMPLEMLRRLAQAEADGTALTYQINLDSFERQILETTDLKDIKPDRSNPSEASVFQLTLRPPKRVYVVGAVHIAQFLIPMAQQCGFDVTLIDNRPIFATAMRFNDVKIVEDWPSDALANLPIGQDTAVITLTHDDKFDVPALQVALQRDAGYIGALGSRKTQAARNAVLCNLGLDTSRIHGPIGLDIGAKTPAEIAVSIMAQLVETLGEAHG